MQNWPFTLIVLTGLEVAHTLLVQPTPSQPHSPKAFYCFTVNTCNSGDFSPLKGEPCQVISPILSFPLTAPRNPEREHVSGRTRVWCGVPQYFIFDTMLSSFPHCVHRRTGSNITEAVYSNIAWPSKISRSPLGSSCRPASGDSPCRNYEAGRLPRTVGPSTCHSSNPNTPRFPLFVFHQDGFALTPTSCAPWKGNAK